MKGHFKDGKWVEDIVREEKHTKPVFNDNIEQLTKTIDTQIEQYKIQMYDLALRTREASFLTRLKYLFTRRI